MRLALLLVFVAYPLLELALLIRAGQMWGFWAVLGTIIGTGVLGVAILRRQGFRVAEKIAAELNAGRAPVAPLADSGLVFAAGSLLVAPGLIGDALGLVLLVPGVRAWSGIGSRRVCSDRPRWSFRPPEAVTNASPANAGKIRP